MTLALYGMTGRVSQRSVCRGHGQTGKAQALLVGCHQGKHTRRAAMHAARCVRRHAYSRAYVCAFRMSRS